MEQWLEFEEAELRGCLPTLSGSSAPGPAAEPLRRLAAAVAGRACLVGGSLTLADVAVYVTLLPVLSKLPVCWSLPCMPPCCRARLPTADGHACRGRRACPRTCGST